MPAKTHRYKFTGRKRPQAPLPRSTFMATIPFLILIAMTGCRHNDTAGEGGSRTAPHGGIILRLHGSNTIGARLAPDLARAYLMAAGADSVAEEAGSTAEERYLRARFGSREKLVEIWSYGSNTGFNDLAWGKCDIGMSSKPIDNETVRRLSALGDMRSPRNEHVIGLDGIAIIVHPGNPIAKLDEAALAAVFSGRIKDWSKLPGGNPGPIAVYSRDRNSGTFDVFRHLVLGSEPITDSALACESNASLAKSVAADPRAIGYAPAAALGDAKVLEIASGEAPAIRPSKLNIVTEDYALSRRLFLYSPSDPANPQVRPFIDFVQSEAGQKVVENSGFVAQIPRLSKPEIPPRAPARYLSEIRNALRLAVNFRFHPGSAKLDNKARQDLARVARFVDQENLRPCRIKLFGFCDNVGYGDRNRALSLQRAESVADTLRSGFGIKTAAAMGFGSALPVATNGTDAGREKNRRIEVWLDCDANLALAGGDGESDSAAPDAR